MRNNDQDCIDNLGEHGHVLFLVCPGIVTFRRVEEDAACVPACAGRHWGAAGSSAHRQVARPCHGPRALFGDNRFVSKTQKSATTSAPLS
eukprot:572251-Prymnesium_polylepis.1